MPLLRRLWGRWKAWGRFLGNLVARVVLSLFYFTVLVPYGLGVRWFGDPLQIKTRPNPMWQSRTPQDSNLADAGRQF